VTTGTTTLVNQQVTVWDYTLTMDIEVEWTKDAGTRYLPSGAGDPPSVEIDGFEYDEDSALAELLDLWANSDPRERHPDVALASVEEMRLQIAEAVRRVAFGTEQNELLDDGDMHADDREEDDDEN